QLVEQTGQNELAIELAISHGNLGTALFSRQKFDEIIAHYEKALEIQSRLPDQNGRGELRNDLAILYNNRGAVRRAQGKLDAALADFDTAIKSLTPLIEPQGRNEPGTTQTSHGSARVAQVQVDVIIAYSEKDVDIQARSRFADHPGRQEL